MMSRRVFSMLASAMLVFGLGPAWAQTYPTKPVRIIATEAGGITDFVARLIAQEITGSLGQQVIVENRPNSVVLGDTVIKAAPDGYTLLNAGPAVWLLQFLQDNVSYDPLKDFAPVTLATRSPSIFVAHPSLPVRNIKELIALAKSRPGELNYASSGVGSSSHIAPELLKSMAGVNIVRVPYKGAGPAVNDLIGGHVQLMSVVIATGMPHVKSGKLRGLAVTSLQPSALAPGFATVASSGLPGYESVSIQGLFVPAKTPAAIVTRLNQEIVRAVNKPELKEKFILSGVEPVGSTPEELVAAVKAEMTKSGKIIKDISIRN